jgi:hypothetical protein
MWSNNDGMDPNWRPYFPDSVSIDKKELDALREVVEAVQHCGAKREIIGSGFETRNVYVIELKYMDNISIALSKLDEARRG